jgi:hypothetical protein
MATSDIDSFVSFNGECFDHHRCVTGIPQKANTVMQFQIPCHFLSNKPWLLLDETSDRSIVAEVKVQLFNHISDPRPLKPVSIPACLLGASPHALIVRIITSETDSSGILDHDLLFLLNEWKIADGGRTCGHCTLSVIHTWRPSLRLSQQISIIDPDTGSAGLSVTPLMEPPSKSAMRADPNKSPRVMASGSGFSFLFFDITRSDAIGLTRRCRACGRC